MRRVTLMIMLVVFTLLPLAAFAGELDSPGDPASGSGMYTLEELYNYLVNSTTPSVPGAFQEPSAGPDVTMKTLRELYEDFKALIDQCTVAPEQVLSGQKFFSTAGTWGPADGTMADNGALTITPGTSDQAIAQGYHNGSGVVVGDSELTPANIVAGVTIFDVTGTAPTLDPDPNLTRENIKCGVTIYGVTGGRFLDNGDGTVTDLSTGLMWTKNANHGKINWNAAIQYCNDLDYAGYDDWHLPTMDELKTLIDNRFEAPALSNTCGTGQWTEGDAFTGVRSSFYHSSTTNAYNPDAAWNVYLGSGGVVSSTYKIYTYYVWPVRGGQ